MSGIATHYDLLGVRADASTDEIRAAYRRAARTHHPDAAGDSSSTEMARLNEAWRVLSDAARRARYDASLRPQVALGRTTPGGATPGQAIPYADTVARPASDLRRPGERFPFKPLIGLTLLAAVGIVVFSASNKPVTEPGPDWRIEGGSCVTILPNLDAREVRCDAPHDGVARMIVAFDTACPVDTATHRDVQGMGDICVDTSE